jgi:hypothetical protein
VPRKGSLRAILDAVIILAALLPWLGGCAAVTTNPSGFVAAHEGWGVYVQLDDDGRLDALFLRAPEGIDIAGDEYIIRTGPSSQGRASIRVLRKAQTE